MKSKVGVTAAAILMLCVLGVLVGLLLNPDVLNAESKEDVPLTTSPVSKSNIVDEVTGPAEIKGATTEKLKMAKWRYFKAFVAPLDERITAGTTLVEYTNGQTLVAPYDLVIHSKNLPEKKSDELTEDHYVEVSRVDLLHVELNVHENDISRLALGQEAQVKLNADESKVLSGKIVKINEVGSYNATGSKYRVTVEVPNDGTLMIGMSANVSIVVGEATDVLTVPVSAINDAGDSSFVMVSGEDGSLNAVPVETGLSDGMIVEISGDISEGDQVISNENSAGTSLGSSGNAAVYSYAS